MKKLRQMVSFITLSVFLVTNLVPANVFAEESQTPASYDSPSVPSLSPASGTTYLGTGTANGDMSDLTSTYRPVSVSGFNADIIAEGDIWQRDPTGGDSKQAAYTTSMSLEPDGFPVQSVFVADTFRSRWISSDVLFSGTGLGEPTRMLPKDGKIIYQLDGTGKSNTYFQLQAYDSSNAIAIREGVSTKAAISFTTPACYTSLRFLTTGVPVYMSSFRIVFTDNSYVTVAGGFQFGGDASRIGSGNMDDKGVSFVLAARTELDKAAMTKTKLAFNDKSLVKSCKSDAMLDPEPDSLYYHTLSAKVLDLTNITYADEEGHVKTGDLSSSMISKLVFDGADFTTGDFADYRAGYMLAVSGLATAAPEKVIWKVDTSVSTSNFDLNWNDVSGETKYVVEVSKNIDFSAFVEGFAGKEISANTTTVKVTGLLPLTDYYCRITGYSNEVKGTTSEIKTVTTVDASGKFRLLYDLNGVPGTAPVEAGYFANGDGVTVMDGPEGSFIRTADQAPVAFECWNTSSDGSGTDIQPPKTFIFGSSNATLYAKWQISGKPSGSGTVGDPYLMGAGANLVWLSLQTRSRQNHYEGVYFKQTNDIDLSGVNWVPIRFFGGVYNGNGFRIKNLTMEYTKSQADAVGLSVVSDTTMSLISGDYYHTDESNSSSSMSVDLRRYSFGLFESTSMQISDASKITIAELKDIHLVGMKINIDFNTANPDFILEADASRFLVPLVAVGGIVGVTGSGDASQLKEPLIGDWHSNLILSNCTVDSTSSITVKAPNAVVGGLAGYVFSRNGRQYFNNKDNLFVFDSNSNEGSIIVESKSNAVKILSSGETRSLDWADDNDLPYKNVFEPSLTVGGLIGYLSANTMPAALGAGRGDSVTNSYNRGSIAVHSGNTISSQVATYYNDSASFTDPGIGDTTMRKIYEKTVTKGRKRIDEQSANKNFSGATKVGGLIGYLQLAASTYLPSYKDGDAQSKPVMPKVDDILSDFSNLYNTGTVTVDKIVSGHAGNSPDALMMTGSFIGQVKRDAFNHNPDYSWDTGAAYVNLTNNFFAEGTTTLNGNQQANAIGHAFAPPDAAVITIDTDPSGFTNFVSNYYYRGDLNFNEYINCRPPTYFVPYARTDGSSAGTYEYDNHSYDFNPLSWFSALETNKLDTVWPSAKWVFKAGNLPEIRQSLFNLAAIRLDTYDKSTAASAKITPDGKNVKKVVLRPGETLNLVAAGISYDGPDSTLDGVGAVSWTGSDSSVATLTTENVTPAGIATSVQSALITAVVPGVAAISALTAKGGLRDAVTVVVEGIPATAIDITYLDKANKAQYGFISDLDMGEDTTLNTLSAAISPGNATDKTISWSSSNADVATVTSAGIIHVAGFGQVYIYAKTAGGAFSDRITLKVVPRLADQFSIDKSKINLNVTYNSNPTEKITATASRNDGKEVSISRFRWTSSDESVATVSSTGIVYAVGIGTAVIKASTIDGSGLESVPCTVTITGKRVTGIKRANESDKNREMELNEKTRFSVDVEPDDVLCRDIVWTSSDPAKLKVTSNGWVTPLTTFKSGDVTLTAVTVDGSFSIDFAPKSSISERKMEIYNRRDFLKLTSFDSQQIYYSVYPLDAEYRDIEYSSSNPGVASVSSTGKVSTWSAGTAIITMTTKHNKIRESVVVKATDMASASIKVMDMKTKSPVSGVTISIMDDSFSTGWDGKAFVTYPVGDEGRFIELMKSGYKAKMLTLSELVPGSYTVFMEADDGKPYFKYIGKVSAEGQYGNLTEGCATSPQDEVSTVSAWIDWKDTVPGSAFLSKGSKQFRFVPYSSGLYKNKTMKFYDEVKSESGNFYGNAYADPASLPPLKAGKLAKPQQAAISKCIFWNFVDFNKMYGNVSLENADDGKSDLGNSGQSNMFNTGYDMDLPEGCPVQIEIDDDDFTLSVAYKAGMEKGGGDQSWSKSEDEPGGDVDKMNNDELVDSIKEAIVSGKMSDKLKELTSPPAGNKLEKRMEVSVEVYGYIKGKLIQEPVFYDLNEVNRYDLGIDKETFDALKALNMPSMPLTLIRLKINEGGLKVTGDGKVTYSQQFFPGGIPIYVELVIGASIEQIVKFQVMDSGYTVFKGSTQIKPYAGCYGAVGIGNVLSIGPTLNGELPITITYPDPVGFSVKLGLQFGLRVKVILWTKNFKFYNRQWTLYSVNQANSAPQTVAGEFSLAETDPKLEGFEPLPRDYLTAGYETDTYDYTDLQRGRSVSGVKMTSGYPEIMPQLLDLGNGKQMLLWEDDLVSRPLADRTALQYSMTADYGKTWSGPVVIDNDGTADGTFSAAADLNGNVYVAFQSVALPLGPEATLQDFTGLMQIKTVKYNGTVFGTPKVVSNTLEPAPVEKDDFVYEANILPKIVVKGDSVAVVWLVNTANNILGTTGDNVVRYAYLDGSSFTKPIQLLNTKNYIYDISAIYNGGSLTVSYLTDDDRNMATMTDRSIYLLNASSITGAGIKVTTGDLTATPTLTRVNGKTALYWYQDRNIGYLPDIAAPGDVRNVFSKVNKDSSPAAPDFKIITRGDQSMLLYTEGGAVAQTDPDAAATTKPIRNVYSAVYDPELQSWGGFSTNLTQQKEDIGSYGADLDSEGTIHLAVAELLHLTADSDAARLKVYHVVPSVDLSVVDQSIYYNSYDVFNGATSLPIAAYVENNGQLQAKGITLELRDGSNKLLNKVDYPDVMIVPGEEGKRFVIDCPLDKELAEKTVRLLVKPYGGVQDAELSDNAASTVIGCGDLVLGKIQATASGDLTVADFNVVNNSYKKLDNIQAKFYGVDEDGKALGDPLQTVEVGSLDAYCEKGVSADLDAGKIDFKGTSSKDFMILLSSTSTQEVVTVNNSGYITVINPSRPAIPFDITVKGAYKDADGLTFSINAANLTAKDNTGTVSLSVYDGKPDSKTTPVLLTTKAVNLSIAANSSTEEVITLADADGKLADAYMVVARFTSAGSGGMTDAKTNSTYYSNVAADIIADLVRSGNNKLSSLVVNGGVLTPAFSADTADYKLQPSGTSVTVTAAAADEVSALLSCSVNDGRKSYLASGEKSDEIALKSGDVLVVEVESEDGSVRKYSLAVPVQGSVSGAGRSQPIGKVNGQPVLKGTMTEYAFARGKAGITASIDPMNLSGLLTRAENGATVSISFAKDYDVATGELNGQMIKDMENKLATLMIQSPTASYSLPAGQIDIEAVSRQLGGHVSLSDIRVTVKISKPDEETVQILRQAAGRNNLTLVVPAIDFEVSCEYQGKTVDISRFNAYVERRVVIPEGTDPGEITTVVALEPDGTLRHVPTCILFENGVYYAVINSLTNSVYSVVRHPVVFADVSGHWAKSSVNNLGSRMIVSGVGSNLFEPDRDITRAEFAAIIVKALGLKPEAGGSTFADLDDSKWYSAYVETAAAYNLITGYANGNSGPNDKITREQAMTVIARALTITGPSAVLKPGEVESILKRFSDGGMVSIYARNGMAQCVRTGIVSGRPNAVIDPKDHMTRAEVAAIVERLLKVSKLID